MNRRALILSVIILAAGIGRWQVKAIEIAPETNLERLPYTIDGWSGRRDPDLDEDVLSVLKADDVLTRTYRTADGQHASLFVAYYRAQTSGASIHSPLNCLPGSGWQPVNTVRVPFVHGGTIRQVVIEKGEERNLVLYWYQSPTRIEGDEYWSKLYFVLDTMRWQRNDAAIVRIVVPIDKHREDGEAAATAAAHKLAASAEPAIAELLFSERNVE